MDTSYESDPPEIMSAKKRIRPREPSSSSSKSRKKGAGQSAALQESVDDAEYEVEKITEKKLDGGFKKYLVLWKGYPPEEATWVLEKDMHCQDLIVEFDAAERAERLMKRGWKKPPVECEAKPQVASNSKPIKQVATDSEESVLESPTISRQSISESSTVSDVALNNHHNCKMDDGPQTEVIKPEEIPNENFTADPDAPLSDLLKAMLDSSELLDNPYPGPGWEKYEKSKDATVLEWPQEQFYRKNQPSNILRYLMNSYGDPCVELCWPDGFIFNVTFPAAAKLYPKLFIPWLEKVTDEMALADGCSREEFLDRNKNSENHAPDAVPVGKHGGQVEIGVECNLDDKIPEPEAVSLNGSPESCDGDLKKKNDVSRPLVTISSDAEMPKQPAAGPSGHVGQPDRLVDVNFASWNGGSSCMGGYSGTQEPLCNPGISLRELVPEFGSELYGQKLQELRKYVPLVDYAISSLGTDKSRSQELQRLRVLLNVAKNPLPPPYRTLVKCVEIIQSSKPWLLREFGRVAEEAFSSPAVSDIGSPTVLEKFSSTLGSDASISCRAVTSETAVPIEVSAPRLRCEVLPKVPGEIQQIRLLGSGNTRTMTVTPSSSQSGPSFMIPVRVTSTDQVCAPYRPDDRKAGVKPDVTNQPIHKTYGGFQTGEQFVGANRSSPQTLSHVATPRKYTGFPGDRFETIRDQDLTGSPASPTKSTAVRSPAKKSESSYARKSIKLSKESSCSSPLRAIGGIKTVVPGLTGDKEPGSSRPVDRQQSWLPMSSMKTTVPISSLVINPTVAMFLAQKGEARKTESANTNSARPVVAPSLSQSFSGLQIHPGQSEPVDPTSGITQQSQVHFPQSSPRTGFVGARPQHGSRSPVYVRNSPRSGPITETVDAPQKPKLAVLPQPDPAVRKRTLSPEKPSDSATVATMSAARTLLPDVGGQKTQSKTPIPALPDGSLQYRRTVINGIRKDSPGLNNFQWNQIVAKQWRSLSEAEKKPFVDACLAEQAAEKQLASLRRSPRR